MWSTVWNSGLSTPFFAAHHPIWSMMKGTRSFRRRPRRSWERSRGGWKPGCASLLRRSDQPELRRLCSPTPPPTMSRMRMPRTPASLSIGDLPVGNIRIYHRDTAQPVLYFGATPWAGAGCRSRAPKPGQPRHIARRPDPAWQRNRPGDAGRRIEVTAGHSLQSSAAAPMTWACVSQAPTGTLIICPQSRTVRKYSRE